MQGTSIDGPIPSTIAQLKNLTELRISDLNGSSMKFPNLQELKMLNILILRNCFITGPIPDYIGELPNLKLLDLRFNMLTGQIPGTLQSSNLNYMLLTSNSLSGAVPNWILNSKNYFDISYNFTESSLLGCQPSRVNSVSSHSSAATRYLNTCRFGSKKSGVWESVPQAACDLIAHMLTRDVSAWFNADEVLSLSVQDL